MLTSDQATDKLESIPDASIPLVIFDGDCAMCSGAVQLILKLEREPKMHFAPIRGETFKRLIPGALHERETMMLHHQGQTLTESEAVLKIAHLLGAPWSIAYAFRILPAGLRNLVYRWIARNRYRIFGRNESCYLAPPEVRNRFWP